MFKTVLFPIDMSSEAQQAAPKVVELVQFHHSRLILLSVVESPGEDQPQALSQSSPEAVAKLLHQAKDLFATRGIAAEVLERQGQPAACCCQRICSQATGRVCVHDCKSGSIGHQRREAVVAFGRGW